MNNKYIVSIFLVVVVVISAVLFNSKNNSEEGTVSGISSINPTSEVTQTPPTESVTITPMASEKLEKLLIEDIKVGSGEEAVSGKTITVNYKGTLTDGTVFDSSYNRGQPFSFTLGAGEVIQGWDKGFAGMKVGGKRKLTIPPTLGYGAFDNGPIPANSTLIFEVELLRVE